MCYTAVLKPPIIQSAPLWLVFILNSPQPGTHQTVMHLTPLEFHHREDLPQPPSLLAAILYRSSCDWTEVSLSLLPVIAVIEFAFQRLSPKELLRCSLMWLVRLGSRRNVHDVLILSFQREAEVKFTLYFSYAKNRSVDNPKILFF